jgi:uncharacterized membrane protein
MGLRVLLVQAIKKQAALLLRGLLSWCESALVALPFAVALFVVAAAGRVPTFVSELFSSAPYFSQAVMETVMETFRFVETV